MSKTTKDITLSEELFAAVDKLVAVGKPTGSVTEDDIQVALAEIDFDADELSAVYDAIRAQGVDVASAGDEISKDEAEEFAEEEIEDEIDTSEAGCGRRRARQGPHGSHQGQAQAGEPPRRGAGPHRS